VLPQAGPLAGIKVGEPIHAGWTIDAMKVFGA
jgi:spermidine/putrescine transport system ATP-binding protein